jgi:hypothetical protein
MVTNIVTREFYILDSVNSINHCKLFIFADDLKIFRVINSSHDCFLLQSDVNSVSDWCAANSMRLILVKRVLCHTPGRQMF